MIKQEITLNINQDITVCFNTADQVLWDRARNIPSGKWDTAKKEWVFKREYLLLVLDAFKGFSWASNFADYVNEFNNAEQATAKLIEEVLKQPDVFKHGFNKMIPFDHQASGAVSCLYARRAILADQMGLGKTLTSLMAASKTGLPIFVVAPPTLHENWMREAENAGITIKDIFSWGKIPAPPLNYSYTLIVDEAHYGQNIDAKRTKAMLSFSGPARFVFLLSGTPIKNGRASNLFPLLLAIKHPIASNRKEYENNYCYKPNKDTLYSLHIAVRDAIIRRTKEECLDLPPKLRTLRTVDMTDKTKEEFQSTIDMLRSQYHQRVDSGEILATNDKLVLLTHLRHAASHAKIEETVNVTEELIEEGKSVVIFVSFKTSAHALQQKLAYLGTVGMITGGVTMDQRNKVIDSFQKGETKIVVCTFGAGGVGITLTAAHHVILMDRPWTPGEAIQAEDRLHRIGQDDTVISTWLQSARVDKHIDDLLLGKQRNISRIVEDTDETFQFNNINIGEYVDELLEQILE